MHNIWLIAKREYLERVRTKSFIVTTILIPLLMGGGIIVAVLTQGKPETSSRIAVVSADQQLALDLQTEIESNKDHHFTVDVISPPDSTTRATLDGQLANKNLDAYLWITPAAAPGARPTFTYTPRSNSAFATKEDIKAALSRVLVRESLAHEGMVASDVTALMQPVQLDTTQAGKNDNSTAAEVTVIILFFLMYFVIMLYGMNVARSIIEEKTSRVFEVLLATITSGEIMAGKMLGVGAVGLTQVFIWLFAAVLLTGTAAVQAMAGGHIHLALSPAEIIYFFVFFILGFLLYASIAAALGAMTNSEQELQQLNMVLVLPLAACFFAMGLVVTNPNSVLSVVLSLVPFMTPLIMYLRIAIVAVPVWQIGLSIALMLASIYVVLWIASRIYRIGILMYGKKPNLPEILRWLKYS